MKPFALACLLCMAAVGTASTQERVRSVGTLRTSDVNPQVWVDPDTGCKYLVSTPSRYGYRVISTPRLRPDGKVDCPDVK